MRRPEINEFDDVADFELDPRDLVATEAYRKLALMHGSVDFDDNDTADSERLLIGFNKNSYELKVAEDACMPIEIVIQLSRRAFRDILAAKNDQERMP